MSAYLPATYQAPAAEGPPGWTYGYDARGEVERADRFTAAGGPAGGVISHQRRGYGYDAIGNRTSATQGTTAAESIATGYGANALNQYDPITRTRRVEITGQAVAGAGVSLRIDGGSAVTVDRSLPENQTGDPGSYRYVCTVAGTDARWLNVEITATAGAAHVVRSGFVFVPPASFTPVHDADGNLTSDAQWDYTWDAENRLGTATQKVILAAAGFTPPARMRLVFAYDARSRRIAMSVYEWRSVNGAGETWVLTRDLRFVYDGWNMIAELDRTSAGGTGQAGSQVLRRYLWGPDVSGTMTGAGGVGGLLSMTAGGTTYHVCSDLNGNVTGLVPAGGTDAGTLLPYSRYDYDPFGNRITNTGPEAPLCPFGFSTKYTDEETVLVYYSFRYYSPELGRWLSRDPIGERGGINLYGMVANNALDGWDYLGREPQRNTPYNNCDSPVPTGADKSLNDNGTTNVKVRASEVVLLTGHGYSTTGGSDGEKLPHTFSFGDDSSSGAFSGCWPGATNNNITNPQNQLTGAPTDDNKRKVFGGDWLKEKRELWRSAKNKAKSDPVVKSKCLCKVTLIWTETMTKGWPFDSKGDEFVVIYD